MSVYSFDPGWAREKDRLEIQARMLDPGTERHLERLGVSDGWRCAEIGAGAGSVARWLAERVGASGRVVATDLDTRFLETWRAPQLEVRVHDIVSGPLEPAAYDLVHTRLLLMHLPERDRALANMVASLRPGGVVLIEDYDLGTAGFFHPPSPLQARVAQAVETLLRQSGADPRYGIQLLPALVSAGLVQTGAEARLQIVPLGTPAAEALALKLEHFKDRLVGQGLVTAREVEEAIAEARRAEGGVHYPPLMVAAWGQRPHA